jgi:hypothetical protein
MRILGFVSLVLMGLTSATPRNNFGGPADMIPFVGAPVFSSRDEEYIGSIIFRTAPVGRSPGKADLKMSLLSSNGERVEADCPDASYKYIDVSVIFDTSVMSCVGAFRSKLLGFWNRESVAFKWDAAKLILTSQFLIPFTLQFDAELTKDGAKEYDLVGFLV